MSQPSRESALHRFFLRFWYQAKPNIIARCFYPLSQLFFYLAAKRRIKLSHQAQSFNVPVVVIGNISVGGTGKTPLIISLANALNAQGHNVGIVSRGYGSQAPYYPYEIDAKTQVNTSGDEALLIAQATHLPVIIGADRVAAVQALLENYPATQIILSDDGLQHYRLHRDHEIILIDGNKGLGNGYGLPAGPLREPKTRLADAQAIVVNGEVSSALAKDLKGLAFTQIQLEPLAWSPVAHPNNNQKISVEKGLPWQGQVIAIAGIGNPQRFFESLTNLGVDFMPIVFDDHHIFTASDFDEFVNDTIVMTSKDAVKCRDVAPKNSWQLEVECPLPNSILTPINKILNN